MGVSLTGRALRSYGTGLSHGPVSASIPNAFKKLETQSLVCYNVFASALNLFLSLFLS
jgi:hypothetical protein